MKKRLIFPLVFLLVFSMLTTTFAGDGRDCHPENAVLRAPSCSNCMIGQLLRTSRTFVGEETEASKCYYTGCLIIKYYDVYQETYKCNYCGAREYAESWVSTGSEHTIKH